MTSLARPEVIREESVLAAWRMPLLGGLAITALLLWLFSHYFSNQVMFAIGQQADWAHTLVIPLIAGYFVYLNRERLLAEPFRTAWLGLVPIVLGIGWYFLCAIGPQTLRHHNLMGAGVYMTIFGVVLLFFGYRAMIWLWFPLAYMAVFGQTISERVMTAVTFKMQDIAAAGSYVMMVLMGMDVERGGNIITLHHNGRAHPLNIAEACSGMRMLMAFLALGVALAYTGLKRYWQQIALVLLVVPTAIFVNILRVVTLAVLSTFDVEFAAGEFHHFVGLVWLVPAFLLLLGLMWVVRNIVVEEPASNKATGQPVNRT